MRSSSQLCMQVAVYSKTTISIYIEPVKKSSKVFLRLSCCERGLRCQRRVCDTPQKDRDKTMKLHYWNAGWSRSIIHNFSGT